MQSSIDLQLLQDITDDLTETLYLINDRLQLLQKFTKDIQKVRSCITLETFLQVNISAEQFTRQYKELQQRLISALNHVTPTHSTLCDESREFIRIRQQQVAALITATDWQSPTFVHSQISRAGRQEGTIYATINDYKRDQHWDAHNYERAFVNAYVNNLIKFPIYAYATSSGMAAFSTILNFLLLEKKAVGPVIFGESIWFQNRILLEKAFDGNSILVKESDTKQIIDMIITKQPSILFFDSLENSPDIILTDLEAILKTLVKHATSDTYLVIDNTCLGLFLQPLKYIFGKRSKIRLIVLESLNKYHQFGMDRTTGGIIWSYGGDTIKLFDYRVHSGTNIPDVSVLSLPSPNRKLLTTRLLRHKRNTSQFAERLQAWIRTHPASPFSRIVYPGLPNHQSYAHASRSQFHGCFFSIEFKPFYQSIPVYKKFVTQIIRMAKKNSVDLTSGSSFGLNTSRIYLTAVRSTTTRPFIRISVGTEHAVALESLISIFIKTMEKFR